MLDGLIGEFELNIGRFASMLILSVPVLVKKRPSMVIAKKNRIPTLLTCLSLFCANYMNYAATTYIPSGTVNTAYMISYISSTMVLSTAKTLYTERRIPCFTLMCDILSVLLLTLGIIFVVQPESIFGVRQHTPYESFCNPLRFESLNSSTTEPTMGNINTYVPITSVHNKISNLSYFGYLYAVGAGILVTCYVLLGQYVLKTEVPMVVCTWLAVIDTFLSLICTALFESFVFPKNISCIITFLFHAMFTGFMSVLSFLSLGAVPSTDLSVISAISVAIVFCFQFSVLKNASPNDNPGNAMAIVAAVTVSVISILKPSIECLRMHFKSKS